MYKLHDFANLHEPCIYSLGVYNYVLDKIQKINPYIGKNVLKKKFISNHKRLNGLLTKPLDSQIIYRIA